MLDLILPEEKRKAHDFMEKHEDCIEKALYLQIKGIMPVDGPFSISRDLSSGIGPAVTIRCNGCDEVEDITDYECW